MRWLRAAWRWATDWRTGVTVLASILVALLLVVVVTGARTTRQALDARAQTSAAATRRIDMLNDRIGLLIDQAQANARLIGQLSDQVAALQEQVRQLGGTPVIVAVPTTASPSTTTPARPAPATQQPERPTSTTTPAPSTTTPSTTTTTAARPVGRTCAINVCVNERNQP